MSARRFAVVNVIGTITTMLLIRFLGAQLAEPIQVVTSFVASHILELTASTCAVVAVGVALRFRRSVNPVS